MHIFVLFLASNYNASQLNQKYSQHTKSPYKWIFNKKNWVFINLIYLAQHSVTPNQIKVKHRPMLNRNNTAGDRTNRKFPAEPNIWEALHSDGTHNNGRAVITALKYRRRVRNTIFAEKNGEIALFENAVRHIAFWRESARCMRMNRNFCRICEPNLRFLFGVRLW